MTSSTDGKSSCGGKFNPIRRGRNGCATHSNHAVELLREEEDVNDGLEVEELLGVEFGVIGEGALSMLLFVLDADDKPMLPDDKRIGGGVGPLC